jgi:hypothetical protein
MKIRQYLTEGTPRKYDWFVEYVDAKGKTKRTLIQVGKNIEDMYKEFEKTARVSRENIKSYTKNMMKKAARTKYQRKIDTEMRDEIIAKWLAGK